MVGFFVGMVLGKCSRKVRCLLLHDLFRRVAEKDGINSKNIFCRSALKFLHLFERTRNSVINHYNKHYKNLVWCSPEDKVTVHRKTHFFPMQRLHNALLTLLLLPCPSNSPDNFCWTIRQLFCQSKNCIFVQPWKPTTKPLWGIASPNTDIFPRFCILLPNSGSIKPISG